MSSATLVDDSAAAPPRTTSQSGFVVSARILLAVACVLVGFRAAALLSALPTEHSPRVSAYFTDAERYHHIAAHSGVPYADFEVEYPPVTLAFIEVVAQGDVRSTLRGVGLASFVLDLLTLGAVAYGFGRRAGLAYLVLSTPLFLLPFVYFRVDFLVVALTAWGLALVKRKFDASGGALLALAVFAKLWPLTVVPLVLVQRRPRAIVSVVACGAVGALGWLLVGGTAGFQQVLTFRGAKGFQIESVVGGMTRLFTGETPRSESGALRVGDMPFA
ncbi:MAG: glycosyltransferase family 87 protein, partial [Acidimicrobiia bacterium]